jgi:hypothetical protein
VLTSVVSNLSSLTVEMITRDAMQRCRAPRVVCTLAPRCRRIGSCHDALLRRAQTYAVFEMNLALNFVSR